MNSYSEYHKYTAAPPDGPNTNAILKLLSGLLGRAFALACFGTSIRNLDRLDDRLLKDIGLYREHLPNGTTRICRR
ncbi:MAG TPA: DUF1127 domain-containing protein [Alphaproteobacteria bacterium]|nr:DUF1127 domain-containing protein [Alphaproteobacteria bacterium]